ncbi:MAG: Lrp/AsnC family transcriptional regulator [Pseudoxanthomonas sp.]
MMLSEKEMELLRILRKDARKTVSAIARELSLSRPTVQSMLERLDVVAIQRYTVQLKPEFYDSHIRAFVFMTREPKKWTAIRRSLEKIEQVFSIHTVTGQLDVIIELQVTAGHFSDMDRILAEIVSLDGVTKTQTCMVLASKSLDRF